MPGLAWFAVHHRGGRDAGAVAARARGSCDECDPSARPSFILEEPGRRAVPATLSCDLLSDPPR